MHNKKASAVLWISIAVILVLAVIGPYFLFFNMSESKASEIIRSDFSKDSNSVCDRFMVNDDNCGAFVSCYSTKAINAMPKNLLIQFAKDIKAGKSRAIDSYSITNGKELGEDCIEEILNVPENVDININSAGSGETISPEEMEYIIDEDIGAFVYDKPGKIDTVGRNSISYMAFYYLNGVSESENSALATIEVFPDTASRESYFDTWISSQSINSEKTIDGLKVYDITSSIDDRFDRKRSVWITDNFVVRISEPKTRQDILNAYIGKYS